jgi:uncharacterized protein (DUF58 family)
VLRRTLRSAARLLRPRTAASEALAPLGSMAMADATFGRYDRLSFVSRRPVRAGLGGEHRSRRRAPSTDFVDYRPYHPGDDFRRIDWNVYGRLGSLQVKLTEGRERLDLTLVLDCSASMAWGEPDRLTFAARVLAALAYVGLARYDAVQVVCLGQERGATLLGPLRGRVRFPDVVALLSSVRGDGEVDLSTRLTQSLPGVSNQSLVVLVSDLLAPSGVEHGLDALKRDGADVVVIHVVSNAEANPNLAGDIEMVDAETDEVLEVGLSVEALERYRQRYQEWLRQQETVCAGRGLRYVRVNSDGSIDSAILNDLRHAGVLR